MTKKIIQYIAYTLFILLIGLPFNVYATALTNPTSLIHYNNDFTDETGKIWTHHGSNYVSATQSVFGGKSLYFNGSFGFTAETDSSWFLNQEDWSVGLRYFPTHSGWQNGELIFANANCPDRENCEFNCGIEIDQLANTFIIWSSSTGTTWDIPWERRQERAEGL
jgi:hypothetical protein